MGETNDGPGLASYRDQITELMETGVPSWVVEEAIDQISELDEEAKAALWLLTLSKPVDRNPRAGDPGFPVGLEVVD